MWQLLLGTPILVRCGLLRIELNANSTKRDVRLSLYGENSILSLYGYVNFKLKES